MLNTKTISELREKTGAGIVDCKKALEETNGDIHKAAEILREKGIAKAAKRTDREASEGVIKVAVNNDNNEGYMVEANAETDFVALNEKFQAFADQVLAIIKAQKITGRDALLAASMDNGTVKDNLDNLSSVIGEKLDIKNADTLSSSGTVVAYSHMDGKIGVLVALDKTGQAELGHDIAMQIAAMHPKYISREQVPAEEINKEKEMYTDELKREGKPENMIEKIIVGKLNKYFGETCLVDQEFIKDDTKKIKDVLGEVKIEKFIVYSLAGTSERCGL
jgi:elongation factor Ts